MSQELLQELKGMDTRQILRAIAQAETGSAKIYSRYLPSITKRETFEQLNWFIDMAQEGVKERK